MATIVYIGAYEPKDDNEIPDNTNPAWRIHQGATDYLVADTTDGAELVKLVSSGVGDVIANNSITVQKADNTAEFRVQNSTAIRSSGMGLGGDDDILRLFADDDAQGSGSAIEFHVDGAEGMKIVAGGNVTMNAGLSVANTSTPGTDGVAIGQSAQAGGTAAVALGRLNNSGGAYGVTAGTGLTASGVKSSAFGVDCYAGHHSSLALGFKANTAFIQSLAMVGTPAVGGGGAQTMMCLGTVETTDASETYLDTSDGSEDLEIFSSPGISKSQVIQIEATILSICSSASGAYAVDDFVSRKYNFAIQYTYNSAVAGFIGASNTGISSGGSMNGSREYVFTDDASGIGSASAGTGIDDKLYFATSTNKVSVKISVTGGEASATVRHVAHITAKTITMD
tara:strand:- start:1237 stop:2424 length:1188 start_codon:yes stop_codon:yes gene_type:complete